MNGAYLTVREAADHLNMHFMSVYKLVQSGGLPAMKVGHRWKIPADELKAWVGRHRGGRRSWLVLGASEAFSTRLQALLGGEHDVHCAGFNALNQALSDELDIVLIDARDTHAALATVGWMRRHEVKALVVLMVGEADRALVEGLVDGGVVTVMPRRASTDLIEQLERLLQRR